MVECSTAPAITASKWSVILPLYLYVCEDCKHEQEDFVHSYKYKKETMECVKCGGVCTFRIGTVQIYNVETREWNGQDVGKKIKEKNEMLKAREADYESSRGGKDAYRRVIGQ